MCHPNQSSSRMNTIIIGIDCATKPEKTGISVGTFHPERSTVESVHIGSQRHPIARIISDQINRTDCVLLALDAPLGWSTDLGRTLTKHQAGQSIDVHPDLLFSRFTDKFVWEHTKKKPLDVGADRIARTAHAALSLLNTLRRQLNEPLPLAWSAEFSQRIAAIEVYPAVTLLRKGIQATGYKRDSNVRESVIDQLHDHIKLPADTSLMIKKPDVLDSGICLLAGTDFLNGDVNRPIDMETAKKEGWIWF